MDVFYHIIYLFILSFHKKKKKKEAFNLSLRELMVSDSLLQEVRIIIYGRLWALTDIEKLVTSTFKGEYFKVAEVLSN